MTNDMTIDEVLAATPLFGVADPRTISDLAITLTLTLTPRWASVA